MVAPKTLADFVFADIKALLAGWICRRRLNRAAVRMMMAEISKQLDSWVRELQETQRRENPRHGHSDSQSEPAA